MTTREVQKRAEALIADIKAGNDHGLPTEPTWCWKTAHLIIQLLTGEKLWPVAISNAKLAYAKLAPTMAVTVKPQPGDLLFWPDNGDDGHVAVYVGDGVMLENTSGKRGKKLLGALRAGTTIPAGAKLIRPPFIVAEPLEPTEPEAAPEPADAPLVVIEPWGGRPHVVIPAENKNGTLHVPVRALAEALGFKVEAKHLQTRGRVYIKSADSSPKGA